MAARAQTPDQLNELATAAFLAGRENEAFDLWTRGHKAAVDAGEPVLAARLGIRLGFALAFKGDMPRASGWAERVRHILDEGAADCVEVGYVDFALGMGRIFEAGDIPGARTHFAKAVKIADRFRDPELRTMSRIGEARCLIYLGEIAEGVAMLDEAMVAVEAGDIPAMTVGDAYCTVIDACTELFDLRRSEAWVRSFTNWCATQPGMAVYRGHCLMHQAEIRMLHGELVAGVAAATEACERLSHPPNYMALGGAHYLRGELLRRRGDLTGAEQAYEQGNEAGCEPQPGLSLVRLAQGRVDVASAAIRRVAAQADGPVDRARMLAAFIEIVLEAGDIDGARAAAAELGEIAAEFSSPFLKAHATQQQGTVLLAGGDPAAALAPLRRAQKAWAELDVPYEAARTRRTIAAACEAMGDHEGMELERAAARATFERIGAVGDLQALDAASGRAEAPPDGLTAREVEVLALVAKGHTNRTIAEQLFISEKTVASHLGHVFTKLNLSSRAAATAYAYENRLV